MSGKLGVTEQALTPADILAGEVTIQAEKAVANGEGVAAAGTVLAKGFDGKYYRMVKGTAVAAEVIAAQSGTAVTFTGNLANRFVIPGSITIKATIGAAEVELVEDGHGRLAGDDGAGTISYGEDGSAAFSITFDTAPDNPSNITADYEHGAADLKHIPAVILLAEADATSAEAKAQTLLLGAARSAALTWPTNISAAHKADALDRLAKRGLYAV